MPQHTKKTTAKKPAKPYADFPLFAHANGQWTKKIRGKFHYFGAWDEPLAALTLYQEQRDDLHVGRTPRTKKADEFTVRDLANHFLSAKEHQVEAGELSQRTFDDYHATCERIVTAFGKIPVENLHPDDFLNLRKGISSKRGPVALGNEVQRVRTIFKHAFDSMLIDRPVQFGPTFKRPARRILRAARQASGPRLYTAKEITSLVAAARVNLNAMILLGINAGFGNSDCGNLPLRAVDLKTGWLEFPRPKTSVERRVPLWPETVAAIRKVITARPKPSDRVTAKLLFLTETGLAYAKMKSNNPITKDFTLLSKRIGVFRPRLGFYGLRHTFETVAGGTRDQVAVDHIMGHARDDMASVYREEIDDSRLMHVVNHVHAWLFAADEQGVSDPENAPQSS